MNPMKSFLVGLVVISSAQAQAEIDLNKLSGQWVMLCTQVQDMEKQGYVIETYGFSGQGRYSFTKEWFLDSKCRESVEKNVEKGSIKIGKENTNNGFNPSGTHETVYTNKKGNEFGLLWVNEDYTKLRLSRGFGTTQNTMLGIFEYKKK